MGKKFDWLSWCRMRSVGTAGSRRGVGMTRTTLRHAVEKGGDKSLCGRAVQLFPRAGEVFEGIIRKECPVCRKKLEQNQNSK